MFDPLWFLSLEILYFGPCFNKNISFIQKKERKRKRKQRRVLKKLTVGQWIQEDVGESQPRRWGTTIEDVAETYTYFSLQIRRINLEIRERHLSKIHSAYMIHLSKNIQGNNKNSKIAEILRPRNFASEWERERESLRRNVWGNIFIVGRWWNRLGNGVNDVTEGRHIPLSGFVDGTAWVFQ